MKHLVCGSCGVILDCDFLGISLDEDDACTSGYEMLHWQQEVECDCKTRVLTNRRKVNDG